MRSMENRGCPRLAMMDSIIFFDVPAASMPVGFSSSPAPAPQWHSKPHNHRSGQRLAAFDPELVRSLLAQGQDSQPIGFSAALAPGELLVDISDEGPAALLAANRCLVLPGTRLFQHFSLSHAPRRTHSLLEDSLDTGSPATAFRARDGPGRGFPFARKDRR
jgi:hypothetical protein